MTKKTHQSKSIAHIASISCAIHCILTPILVVFIPFLGHFFENSFFEVGLLLASIFCGIYIIYKGYCQHKKQHAIFLFSIGALFWVVHSVFGHYHHEAIDISLLIGTALVLTSYYVNHRYLKCCPTDCCHH